MCQRANSIIIIYRISLIIIYRERRHNNNNNYYYYYYYYVGRYTVSRKRSDEPESQTVLISDSVYF